MQLRLLAALPIVRKRGGIVSIAALAAATCSAAGLLLGVTPAGASGASQNASAIHYLTNFRTTHLSGRFVTAQGKPIAGAIVYLAINDTRSVTPRASQVPVLAQTNTGAKGTFAFTVPQTAAVLQEARSNHGNLNLLMRAMALPTASVSSPSSPVPSLPAAQSPADANPCSLWTPGAGPCPFPPPPNVPSVPAPTASDVTSYGTLEPEHYVSQVSTWFGYLTDPFSMYPRELVTTVDQTENITLVATKATALATSQPPKSCVRTLATTSCSYNPILPVTTYPQAALPANANRTVNQLVFGQSAAAPAATLVNTGYQNGDCYEVNEWNVNSQPEKDLEPITDMHAWNDMTVGIKVAQGTSSSIGVSVRDETDNGNWTVDGNSSSSSQVVAGNWQTPYGPNWANRFGGYHDFNWVHHQDQCWNGDHSQYWYFDWAEIDDMGWDGGGDVDGQDITNWDGYDQRAGQPSQNWAPEDSDGHGYYWEKTNGRGFHYGVEVQAFGITLGGSTDWNQQVTEDWNFGSGYYTHYLFGRDGSPPSSSIVYAD